MSEIKNGRLGLHDAEHCKCNPMMTPGFKGLRLNSCKLETEFGNKTKLSCLVASRVHTADTDKTRQDSFVLSVSAV